MLPERPRIDVLLSLVVRSLVTNITGTIIIVIIIIVKVEQPEVELAVCNLLISAFKSDTLTTTSPCRIIKRVYTVVRLVLVEICNCS